MVKLEGKNLGKIHQHYNDLLKQALRNNNEDLSPIDYNATDIDNFLKIDIACHKKNVDYILEVFKSNDLLYASRAIKKAPWLITNDQHANIINPQYLHSELFPTMTSKATHKLLLQIRLNLRNEKRVEEFYKYFEDKDFNNAAKWLPGCAVDFVKDIIPRKINDIKMEILTILSKKSFELLKVIIKSREYYKQALLESNMHYLYLDTHTDLFLDLVESSNSVYPRFGSKATKLIHTKCPERIFNKLDKYLYQIDIETFAKNMKKEDIKDFIKKICEDKSFERFVSLERLKPFINKIPKEERFDYVTKIFSTRPAEDEHPICPRKVTMCAAQCDYVGNSGGSSFANIYRSYIYASFDKAFLDLNKLIRSESSANERNAMLLVMLTCAKNNEDNIRTLLEYYVRRHINAPPNFKVQFVNNVISKTKVHTYDSTTWSVLNEIFYSLGIYNVNDKETTIIQTCLQTIVVYMVLHNQTVPEVIEQKFSFNSFKNMQYKLNDKEKEAVFTYLYNTLKTNIEKQNITSETHFHKAKVELEHLLTLIRDFRKNVQQYPFVLEKVHELMKLKFKNSWDIDLTGLYNFKKSWRRYLFEESLVLYPTEDACLNALKHDPELLTRYTDDVKRICSNDSVKLTRFLRKIRTYWPASLATEWSAAYLKRLQENDVGTCISLIKGLCVLLPQDQLVDILKKHSPKEEKITWSNEVEAELAIRKQFAKNMFLARPLLPADCVLWYAKGDYLQFALPSFESVLYDLSPEQCMRFIPILLNAPVSLQKHGIRLAFKKQKSENISNALTKMWSEGKNPTIRMELFKETFKLICSQKNITATDNLWTIFKSFMNTLTSEENKQIYDTLGQTDAVPPAVRPEFTIKSYNFLKSLPAQANCEDIVNRVVHSTIDIMADLDINFMSNIILDDLENKIIKKSFDKSEILATCMLNVKDECTQLQRYEEIMVPVLNKMFEKWDHKEGDDEYYSVRQNLGELLNIIFAIYEKYVCVKRLHNPLKLLSNILDKLEKSLPLDENYVLLRKFKLMQSFAQSIDLHKGMLSDIPEETEPACWWSSNIYNELYYKANEDFAHLIFSLLKEDTAVLFPSVNVLIKHALVNALDTLRLHSNVRLSLLKHLLEITKEFIPGVLVVIDMLPPEYAYKDDKDKEFLKDITPVLTSHPAREVRIHYYSNNPYGI